MVELLLQHFNTENPEGINSASDVQLLYIFSRMNAAENKSTPHLTLQTARKGSGGAA